MKTLLLLGGRSNRFWPLKEKPLCSIAGKTLLEHLMDRLQKGGCENITLVASKENKNDIAAMFPSLEIVEQNPANPGMSGALIAALPSCGDEPVMVVGGNDVIDPSAYSDLIAAAKKPGVDGAILGQKVSHYFPGGYVALKGDCIDQIIEKPGESNEPSEYVNIVAHVHGNAKTLLDVILRQAQDDSDSDDVYERAMSQLFQSSRYVLTPYIGIWEAIKYPWHLLNILPILLNEMSEPAIHPSADVHKTAIIEGNVILEEGVKVFPNAMIKGPTYIGAGTIIANNALVRGSSIGQNCVVGYNTEVKNCLLGNDVWTHMTYLGDSVLGNNVSCGAGTVTGNLRLDEVEIYSVVKEEKINTHHTKLGAIIGNDCRLGIQVSLDPGVKIGVGSFISSATHIPFDIPEKQFVKLTNGVLDVRENTGEVPQVENRDQYKKSIN